MKEAVMFYLGLDMHKKTSYVTLMDQAGAVLQQQRVPSTRTSIGALIDGFPKPLHVALEATRNWYWMYDFLADKVQDIKLAHPPKTKLIAEARIKTDKLDSRILADLLRTNYLPTCYVPDPETRQRRELLRHRAYLIRIRVALKNRIHAMLAKLGIEHTYEDLFTKQGMEFLHNLELPWAYQKALTDDLSLIEDINTKDRILQRKIRQLCKATPLTEILMSLPGIAYHNALLIISEVGDINRFPDGAHFASYCGLVTQVHISDQTVHYGGITRNGNRWLRWLYVEASFFARRYSYRFGHLYERVKNRAGVQKAIVAVAREMAVVTYYMLKRNQKFRDHKIKAEGTAICESDPLEVVQ
jgi:transposase